MGGNGGGGGVKASASSECGTPVATSPCHHRRRGSSKVSETMYSSRSGERERDGERGCVHLMKTL